MTDPSPDTRTVDALTSENQELSELVVLYSTVLDQLSALIRRILACESIHEILDISVTYVKNMHPACECLLILEEGGSAVVSNATFPVTDEVRAYLLRDDGVYRATAALRKETRIAPAPPGPLRIDSLTVLPLYIRESDTYFGALCIHNLTDKHADAYLYFVRIIARIVTTALNNHRVTESLSRSLRDLKEYESRLLQEEKMATIGQLAAGIAHEINNPMAFINSNLQSLKKYSQTLITLVREYENLLQYLRSNLQERNLLLFLERINVLDEFKNANDINWVFEDIEPLLKESIEGTMRVKEIVSNLRDFAHIDSGKIAAVDVNQNIRSTLKIIYNELKYKVELKEEYGELPHLSCHAQQLSQVFLNLLTNAVQAIPEKGTITIRTRTRDEQILVEIQDTGAGIPPEIRGRIFEPFFTTKEVGKGTGLGLHISYNIVREHGGQIQVESVPGQGSTFTVVLPLKNGLGVEGSPG